MSEAGGVSCFAEVVNLKSKLHLYVCMYSAVNSVESVTRQQCGHVMLYLPSKTAVLSDLLTVLYIFDFLFSLNWKLEGLLYL